MNIYRKLIVFVLLINMNQEIININSENISNNSKEENNNENNSSEENLENNADIEDIKFYSFKDLNESINESVNENIDDNNIEFYKKLIESILEMESKFNNLSANQKKSENYKKIFADFKTHFTIPSLTDISKLFMSIKYKKDIENLTRKKIIKIIDKEEKNKLFIQFILDSINKFLEEKIQNIEKINMDSLKIRLFFYIYLQQYTFIKNDNNKYEYINIIKNNINNLIKDIKLKIKDFFFILKQMQEKDFYPKKNNIFELKDKYSNIETAFNQFFPQVIKNHKNQQLKYLAEIIDSIISIDYITIQIDKVLNKWLNKRKNYFIKKLNKGARKNKSEKNEIEQDSFEILQNSNKNSEELKQNNQKRKTDFNNLSIKKNFGNENNENMKILIKNQNKNLKKIIFEINNIIFKINDQYSVNKPLIKQLILKNENENKNENDEFIQIILKNSNRRLKTYNKIKNNIFKGKIVTDIIFEEQQNNNQNINQFSNKL